MLRLFTLPFIVLLHAWIVSAQFQFFEQMFGGHPGQHQQQHQQQQRPSGASYYAAQADSIACSEYLCPETLVCVHNPTDCPCPDVQDIKCSIPDRMEKGAGTVLCVRGQNECAAVERLLNAYAK